MRYTYQQLETIRERARALGLSAELDARASDPDEPFLSIRLPEASDSLAYFTDLGRLSSLQTWGEATAAAAEIDKLHATLTADFPDPLEPGYGRVCRGCAKALYPVGCESGGCAGRAAETSEAVP